jgi:AMMECR1 domain-containing protein
MHDLPKLKVGLSLLTNFSKESLKDPLDWTVGKHGVKLKIKFKGKKYDSVFLPEVA